MAWFNALLEHFAAHPVQFILLLALVAFIKSTVFLSSILPPASVILLISISAGLPIMPAWTIWLAIAAGAAVGSAFNFHLGRVMIRTGALNNLATRHEARFLRIHSWLHANTALALFISRFFAVLRYLVPLAAGMLRLRPISVYCISTVSAAVWSAIYVSGSNVFLSMLL